jgi:hypothetical protein
VDIIPMYAVYCNAIESTKICRDIDGYTCVGGWVSFAVDVGEHRQRERGRAARLTSKT